MDPITAVTCSCTGFNFNFDSCASLARVHRKILHVAENAETVGVAWGGPGARARRVPPVWRVGARRGRCLPRARGGNRHAWHHQRRCQVTPHAGSASSSTPHPARPAGRALKTFHNIAVASSTGPLCTHDTPRGLNERSGGGCATITEGSKRRSMHASRRSSSTSCSLH